MSGFRNRRSSMHEPHCSSTLYRGHSDFSGLSSLAGSTPKKYDSSLKSQTSRDSLSTFRTASSHSYGASPLGRRKSSSSSDFFDTKDRRAEREPLLTRYGRRQSESSSYRIGAYRYEPKKDDTVGETEARLARLSHSSSLASSSFPSSTARDVPRRTSSGLSSAFSRTASRTSSFASARDTPPFRPLPEEPSTRLSTLKRSLSGRLSGSLPSPTSRPSPTKTIKSSSTADDSPRVTKASICGLRNVGNSCYQNAVIQFLRGIPEFVDCMVDAKTWRGTAKIAPELSNLLSNMAHTHDNAVVDAFTLRRQLGALDRKWASYSQEDAHEFLTQIISALQEDCNRNLSKPEYVELKDRDDTRIQAIEEWKYSKQWNDSDIDDIFGFQLHNQIKCPTCQHISSRFGYLTSLEVPLPETPTSLEECLGDFSSAEMLDKENAWKCPGCKSHVQAVQQLRLSRLPKILLVCLKRFGTSNGRFSAFHSWKNTVSVQLPSSSIQLQHILSPAMDTHAAKSARYELIGVVDHSGSVNFGHYTARVKDTARNTWYLMNDELVRRISPPVGSSESAYILALRQVEAT